MKKALADLKEQMEQVVEAYTLGFDPCKYCKKNDRSKKKNLEECLRCCFYYGSNFEVDDGIKNHSED